MATKSFVLERRCQLNTKDGAILCDPKGYGGTIENLKVKKIKECKPCKGTGIDNVCRSCRGGKTVGVMRGGEINQITCTTCDGTGKVEDQNCYYCKGTKRSFPPHHYRELNDDGEGVDEGEDLEKREFVIAELLKLGVKANERWGTEKLENMLVERKRLLS